MFRVLAGERWRRRNLRVACYGSGDQFGQCVHRLAERYAPGMIEFKGVVSNIEQVWRENHALAMPSRCEGLPLALVEAMLCSRCALVTDVAGHTELVKDGINGFVAKAPTVGLLDEALERAWNARNEWRSLGLRARETVTAVIPKDPATVFAKTLEDLSSGPAE